MNGLSTTVANAALAFTVCMPPYSVMVTQEKKEVRYVKAETFSFYAPRAANVLEVTTSPENPKKSERAALVDRLLAIRNRAIANGMRLQSVAEIRSAVEAMRDIEA